MSFDAKAYALEGGAVADVRDSLKAMIAHCEPRNVDARTGKQPFIGGKIDCRNEKLCTDSSAFRRIGVHAKHAAKHPAGAANISSCDCASYCGAGDFDVVNADGPMDIHPKSKLFTEGAKFADTGFCSVTEAEVGAFVNSAYAEAADENVADKIMAGNA